MEVALENILREVFPEKANELIQKFVAEEVTSLKLANQISRDELSNVLDVKTLGGRIKFQAAVKDALAAQNEVPVAEEPPSVESAKRQAVSTRQLRECSIEAIETSTTEDLLDLTSVFEEADIERINAEGYESLNYHKDISFVTKTAVEYLVEQESLYPSRKSKIQLAKQLAELFPNLGKLPGEEIVDWVCKVLNLC